jgi:hypothetical protein
VTWREAAILPCANGAAVRVDVLPIVARVDHEAARLLLEQCFVLDGTNKKDGFWVLERRKPQR